jgi:L-lactate dehydrogenase complex protein LldE
VPPARASLFVTCLVDLLYPEVGQASVAVLEDLGVAVDFPAAQTCCGQPAWNAGYPDDARRVGTNLLDAMEGAEAVVTPSGSCAGMVRSFYPHLFEGTRDARRAQALADRTYELSQFVVDELGVPAWSGRWDGRVTVHDSCHGLREVGLTGQGRALMAGIEGLEVVEMSRPDLCCGFGGTFSLKLPEVATAMADDKLAQSAATGAQAIVSGDSGCLMHLAGRMSRTGSPMRPLHLATLLAEARGLVPAGRGAR